MVILAFVPSTMVPYPEVISHLIIQHAWCNMDILTWGADKFTKGKTELSRVV